MIDEFWKQISYEWPNKHIPDVLITYTTHFDSNDLIITKVFIHLIDDLTKSLIKY